MPAELCVAIFRPCLIKGADPGRFADDVRQLWACAETCEYQPESMHNSLGLTGNFPGN